MKRMSVSFPAANPARNMNETCAHISALPLPLSGSAARWSAPNGNTTLYLFEQHMKTKMQMPVGAGAHKSAERLAVENELAKHTAKGLTVDAPRLASLTGADLESVRKMIANLLKNGHIVNAGTRTQPGYKMKGESLAQEQAPTRLIPSGSYDGAELRPYEGRPHAMDAFALPSLVNGKQVEPRRPAAMCASSVPERAG